MLLSTSAIREYKRLHPDDRIIYETFIANHNGRYQIEYPNGYPAEMLIHNPDIDQIVDWGEPCPEYPDETVNFHYAEFGGPSLDYPIQAHYWENMGLTWKPDQRFDSYYYPNDHEIEWMRGIIGSHWIDDGLVVLTPQTGWPGKAWTDAGWYGLISWALREGLHPVILAGHKLAGAGWNSSGVVNLSGQLNMRQSAAVLSLSEHAVMTEGGAVESSLCARQAGCLDDVRDSGGSGDLDAAGADDGGARLADAGRRHLLRCEAAERRQ